MASLHHLAASSSSSSSSSSCCCCCCCCSSTHSSLARLALKCSAPPPTSFGSAILVTAQHGTPTGQRIPLRSVASRSLAALSLSAALQFSPLLPHLANASEFNILNEGPPKESHVLDDASVLSRVTKSDLKRLLTDIEDRKGYHIDFVTLRKLSGKSDVFEFADQVLERWYPTIDEGTNKGLVLLVTAQKEGAVTGGPAFIEAVGDTVLEGVVSENLPGNFRLELQSFSGASAVEVLATDEKYNEAVFSTAKRLAAVLDGLPDPGGPKFQENKRESNFKTKQETEEKRGQFTTVVVGLLVIAFVVPMAQYYAYVSKK